jgi:hypothetical protein
MGVWRQQLLQGGGIDDDDGIGGGEGVLVNGMKGRRRSERKALGKKARMKMPRKRSWAVGELVQDDVDDAGDCDCDDGGMDSTI